MKRLFRGSYVGVGPRAGTSEVVTGVFTKKDSIKSQRATQLDAELLQKVKTSLSTMN